MTRRRTGLGRRNPSEFGTVEERGGRYRAFFRRNGETVRAPRTFDSRAAARSWLADQERSIRGGSWIDPRLAAETVGGYAESWLASRTDLAPRTVEFYRSALDRWIVPKIGNIELSALTPSKVSAWRLACLHDARERAAQLKPMKGNPVRLWAVAEGLEVGATGRIPGALHDAWVAAGSPTPSSSNARGDGSTAIAAAYRVLKTIMGSAERDDIIERNPCRMRNAGAVKATERVPATPEQVSQLALAMPARYRAAVVLAAWSGLRSGELRALARKHVDLEARVVRVERAVVEAAGHAPTFGATKTAGSRRSVALPAFVVEALRVHMEEFVADGGDALLFATTDGSILTRNWIGDMFRRARTEVGLPQLRWHDLRHTGASLAYAVGASVPEVQRRLGHTTMRAAAIYAHAYESADHALAKRLSEAFSDPREADRGAV